MFKRLWKIFLARSKKTQNQDALQFDGLNPMLARQLSEVEGQIGNLLEAQFRISEERERMRSEMESLISTLRRENTPEPAAQIPPAAASQTSSTDA